MLSTDLRREPRWRLLADQPTARLTYLSFMTSSLVSYTGFFQLPLPVFSYESMIPEDKLRLGLSALCKVGMIEFSEQTEIVRIDGWFNGRRTPENLNYLKASIRSYEQPHLPKDEIMARSVAELSLSALQKSRTLKVNKANPEASERHRANYVSEIITFIERGLGTIDGLEAALGNWFANSDPRVKAYYTKLSETFPQLRLSEFSDSEGHIAPPAIQSQIEQTETLSEALADPLDTLAGPLDDPLETLPEEEEQRNTNTSERPVIASPLQGTIDSDLAVAARRA